MVNSQEGDNITLSCNYSSATSLLWYYHIPGSAPQFLLLILHSRGSAVRAEGLDPRLEIKRDPESKCVDLEISSAKVKDSGLYYCALTPTVTGSPMVVHKNLQIPQCPKCVPSSLCLLILWQRNLKTICSPLAQNRAQMSEHNTTF